MATCFRASSGYITLAQVIHPMSVDTFNSDKNLHAFNFGPSIASNKDVKSLVEEILIHWPGSWEDKSSADDSYHEAKILHLNSDKASHVLNWSPKWDFKTTVERTVLWYSTVFEGESNALQAMFSDIALYFIHKSLYLL